MWKLKNLVLSENGATVMGKREEPMDLEPQGYPSIPCNLPDMVTLKLWG